MSYWPYLLAKGIDFNRLGSWVSKQAKNIFGIARGAVSEWDKPDREAAIQDQGTLMGMQLGYNKEAAEHSQELQKEMIDYTSPAMTVQRYKDAGLNPALIYGSGGGTSGQTTGSSNVSGVSNGGTDFASRKMANIQAIGMGLQMQRIGAEIANIKADTKTKEVDAYLKASQTQTNDSTRDLLVEKLRQEGIEKWLNNQLSTYKQTGTSDGVVRNPILNWYTEVKEDSPEMKLFNETLLKVEADKGNSEASMLLTKEKTKGYAQELINATITADANRLNAVSNKLNAEFNTGTDINWKNLGEVLVKLLGVLRR